VRVATLAILLTFGCGKSPGARGRDNRRTATLIVGHGVTCEYESGCGAEGDGICSSPHLPGIVICPEDGLCRLLTTEAHD
jgi:hypothetical protein